MRRVRWGSAWTAYALTLLSALPLGAILAAANPMPEGACSGIGFGCSLYGWDVVGLAAIVFGIPYALVLAVAILLLGRLPERHRWVQRAVAWLGLASLWVTGLVVAASL